MPPKPSVMLASEVASDMLRGKLHFVRAVARRSGVFPLAVECDGNLQFIIDEDGRTIVIPTRFVGAVFSMGDWWIVEVFANDQFASGKSTCEKALYKWTHLETRSASRKATSASGMLKEVALSCGKTWKTSTNGKQISGLFSKYVQAIVITCCKEKLADRPELLVLAESEVSICPMYDEMTEVLASDPLRTGKVGVSAEHTKPVQAAKRTKTGDLVQAAKRTKTEEVKTEETKTEETKPEETKMPSTLPPLFPMNGFLPGNLLHPLLPMGGFLLHPLLPMNGFLPGTLYYPFLSTLPQLSVPSQVPGAASATDS